MRLGGSARTIVRISAAGALAGAVYSYLAHDDAFAGFVIGAVNGAAVPWLEIRLRGPAGAFLRRLPFLGSFALRSALFLAVILVVNVVCVPLVNGFDWRRVLASSDIVFAVAATVVGNLLLSVEDLLGRGVLFAFAAGRYHRPRLEERALLFIDLRASTATAERLGASGFSIFSTPSSPTSRPPSLTTAGRSTNTSVTRSSRPGVSRRSATHRASSAPGLPHAPVSRRARTHTGGSSVFLPIFAPRFTPARSSSASLAR